MQTFKDKQQELFKWEHLPESTRKRLDADWCGVWQREIMPMIDERLFSSLYCADDGRPSKSTADMISILILKEKEDLSDEETSRRVAYGLDWQYAMDMAQEDAYVAERTIQYFRDKVMRSEKHRELFSDMAGKIIVRLGTRTGLQRKDSSHIMSNMAHLTRLGLFVETISLFLRQLRKAHPRSYGRLDGRLLKRYVEREAGGFGDARGSDARRRLEDCALDAWTLIERFKKNSRARALDGWRLLERLFAEQCEIEEGGKITLRADVSPDSLQSPHDEDAGYSGHKGKGYQAQITETCDPENETQIITQVEVESACISDAQSVAAGVEELDERGLKPDEMIADTAYCGGNNDVALRDLGVALTGPAAGREPARSSGLAGFHTSDDLKTVFHCPLGVEPLKVKYTKKNDTIAALFDKETCLACRERAKCPVRRRRKGCTLTYTRSRMATAKRRETEKTESYKKTYAMRAAIEGTNSELKRAHGMGRLRVRGQPAVEFAVTMKITACNIKRCINALMARTLETAKATGAPVEAARGREKAPYSRVLSVFDHLCHRARHLALLAA